MEGLIYTGSNQRIPEYHAWTCLCLGSGARTYLELGCGSAHSQKLGGMNVLTVDILSNGLGDIPHIQQSSNDPELVTKVLNHFGDRPDITFIDADHSYDAVKADWELWWFNTKKIVAFHDILMPGVRELWEEISLQYPSIQIIGRDIASAEAWQHQGHVRGQVNCGGIGVLFKT
jgi:hypothetical protein